MQGNVCVRLIACSNVTAFTIFPARVSDWVAVSRVLCHLCHTWHVVGGINVQNPQPAVASHAVQQSGAVFSSVSDKSCPAKFVFAKVLHDSETTAAGTSTNIARAIDFMVMKPSKVRAKKW